MFTERILHEGGRGERAHGKEGCSAKNGRRDPSEVREDFEGADRIEFDALRERVGVLEQRVSGDRMPHKRPEGDRVG